MRKTGSRQDSSDEDHHDDNLRTTCDGCTISKVKCDGGHPCKRCVRKELTCIYREKLRCGPKRRRYERDEEDDDNGVLWVSSSDNRLRARILSGQEREYLKTFCKSVNKSIPITSMIVVRDAMNPLPLEVLEATASVTEAERHIFHARKAVLLGAVALGAVYSGDSDAGAPYMEQAHKHLKDCFDALLPEVVSCYLIMVMFHIHSLEKSKVFRYIGFAQQAFQELSRSQRAGAVNVRDSLVMLSTFLHVTCDSNIQVEQIEVGARDKEEGKAGGAGITCIPSQVLVTFSYVLLFLSRLTDQVIKAKAPPEAFPLPTLAELANMVDEANRLVGMLDDPGVMTTIVIKTLRGYFMLMSIALRETGGHQEGVGRAMQGGEEKEERLNEEKVVKEVGIPVADALDADQGVLHFPLCWQLCRSVSAFLRLKGQVERADGMDHHMSAIKDKVPFADICSSIILRVFHTYVGPNPSSRGVEPPRAGLFTHSSSPQVGRGCPEGTVDTLVTRWQKKRTCHTRGGDIGPIARGISTWASSIPCTDRGHSRSGTNPQTPDMVRHGSATVSGGAAAAATAIDTRPWTTAAAAAAAPLSTAFQQLAVAGDRAGEAASGKPPWDQRGMKADKRSLVLPQGTGRGGGGASRGMAGGGEELKSQSSSMGLLGARGARELGGGGERGEMEKQGSDTVVSGAGAASGLSWAQTFWGAGAEARVGAGTGEGAGQQSLFEFGLERKPSFDPTREGTPSGLQGEIVSSSLPLSPTASMLLLTDFSSSNESVGGGGGGGGNREGGQGGYSGYTGTGADAERGGWSRQIR